MLAHHQRDLALDRGLAVGVEQGDLVAGQRAAHGAGLERLVGRVADLRGGLGLAETVADGDAPGLLHLLDDLGVERLAGADQLAQLGLHRGQVLLDQHAPHGRGRAHGGDLVLHQHVEQRALALKRL
jgi:hypothetical protein